MPTFHRTFRLPLTLSTAPLLIAGLSSGAYCTSPSKTTDKAADISASKATVLIAKASTKKVAYSCASNKKVEVTYSLSAKGVPVMATVTLGKAAQQLAPFGKANGYSLNFAKGDYTLSLDKKKLPVTKAPIMIFQKSKAKVSGKSRDVATIMYRNCSPVVATSKDQSSKSKPKS